MMYKDIFICSCCLKCQIKYGSNYSLSETIKFISNNCCNQMLKLRKQFKLNNLFTRVKVDNEFLDVLPYSFDFGYEIEYFTNLF